MRTLSLACALCAGLTFAASPATAGPRIGLSLNFGGGHDHHGHGHGHWHGGFVVPPPVIYAPPPAYPPAVAVPHGDHYDVYPGYYHAPPPVYFPRPGLSFHFHGH